MKKASAHWKIITNFARNKSMTTMELTIYKMELLREIINNFNSEKALSRLGTACHLIKSEEAIGNLPTMPAYLLEQLLNAALQEDAKGLSISDEEMEQEILSW